MFTKLANVITKADLLAKLVRLRLRQPILPYITPEDALKCKLTDNENLVNKAKDKQPHLELAAITPAVAALVNVAEILKTGQALSNQQSLTKVVNNKTAKTHGGDANKNILYNMKEKEWNILKPGDEARTRHLKWR
ncbi:cytochrome-b5 reductase [Babesia microti strain RI]|uniref:Cytochrome-b5 reductase n=1 Tax=Babesia microti (strain RI) TaxID=1133968 RepID=A0A1R4ACD6_BABMR|nr:cytochrome-b5 reductase [Babesia microti strain RI]SJK86672.1 cytochrome-b5 reductase [Babesia microti strain RI]|eukprot:XP_021338801.1 cytochrome-b5 reductase [Babesia microti strain RI]